MDSPAQINSSSTGLRVDGLFGVAGKRALVTGGSSGIGHMIAQALLANGAEVIIAARNGSRLDAAQAELGRLGDCTSVQADVTTGSGRKALVDAITAAGGLDILVNNAGFAVPEALGDVDSEAASMMLSTNVTAPLLVTEALLSALRDSASSADPSRVVMVGSVDGIRVPAAPLFTYGASKAALHSLTRQLAHTLAPDHVNVNAIAPGMFRSEMTAAMLDAPGTEERISASIPAGRIGAASDIAGAIIYLVSRAGAYLTGAVIPVDGGVSTTHS